MTNPIIENFSLSQLKQFLLDENLNAHYTCNPKEQDFFVYTTPGGMDFQDSYKQKLVEAKFWIQYFPLADSFSLNVNFFAVLDGAPIGANDFIEKVPNAVRPYEYYNGQKIRWLRSGELYVKETPINCPFNAYPGIDTILPVKK